MRKQAFHLILILFLLSIQLASALSINLKPSFQPGETLLATIDGNFLSPLNQDNVYFISDRVSLPVLFDIARINDKYYLYAMLPLQERDYSLLIKDIHYYEAGQEKTIDLEKNFSVSGNITDFSVYPGFIITRGNFSLTLESKTKALDVSATLLNQSQIIHVPIGQSKKLYFSVPVSNFTLTNISVFAGTRYELPVAILSSSSKISTSENQTNFTENITESKDFSFAKSTYSFSVSANNKQKFDIYLKNTGDIEIKNIKLELSDSLKDIISASPLNFNLTEAYSQKIELEILSTSEAVYRGKITAESGDLTAFADITINSLSTSVVPNTTGTKEVCDSYGGIVCSSSQSCKGTVIDSLSGECCLGTCEAKKSYTSLIIGIIIIIAVVAGLVFLYLRQKKAKSASPKQVIEKKAADFEKRLGVESRGSLSRS